MERACPQVALLIDADNSEAVWLPSALACAEGLGAIVTGRVYGNWHLPGLSRWREVSQFYGLSLRHHGQMSGGKNATDIALVVDAMDLLYSGAVDHFCLVASDSDYAPLVSRLRSAGCCVLGIGRRTTPEALRTAYSVFLSADQLLAQPGQPLSPLPKVAVSVATALPEEPLTLLVQAYEEAAQKEGKQENEWVLLSSIGTVLKQRYASFDPAWYGCKDLSQFVKAYAEHFEMRRRASKGKPVQVRRR